MAMVPKPLRSKTGCFPCRRRRVRCEERFPVCLGCQRNNLDCSWPSVSQLLDKRTKHGRFATRPLELLSTSVQRQPALTIGFTRIEEDELPIFVHFTGRVLPQLAHRHADDQFRDHRYLLAIGSQSDALRKAILAFAGTNLAVSEAKYRKIALENYSNSISCLRDGLNKETSPSEGDALLATVVFLCLFEDAVESSEPSNIVAHLPALKSLLHGRLGQAKGQRQTQAFERLCVEVLLYYNVVLLLFDSSHFNTLSSLLDQVDYSIFIPDSDTSVDCPDGTASRQPVIATSYRLYLLVADIIKLARLPDQAGIETSQLWLKLDCDLRGWEDFFCYDRQFEVRNAAAFLAMKALRALLVSANAKWPELWKEQELAEIKNEALSHLSTGFGVIPISKYAVWQLVIIGSLLHDAKEIVFYRQTLVDVYERQPSVLIASASRVLTELWTSALDRSESPTPCLDGIRRLLQHET